MKNVVIVLPTYNERDNIGKLLQIILYQQHSLPAMNLSVLVVDDSSPDGTAEIVKDYMAIYPEQIHLISGKKAGLGAAYVRGFKHAMRELHADIVFEMDADFSHDPNDIPRFVKAIIDGGADFVIGSRYIKGGSIPDDWSLLRKLNSKWGNILARRIAGIKGVNDTTSGFRAITTSLLKRINLNKLNVKGYAFQINILNQAIKKGALVHEVPIVFIDRKFGESKIRIKDIAEFVFSTFAIRMPVFSGIVKLIKPISYTFLFVIAATALIYFTQVTTQSFFITLFISLSLLLTVQGIFNLITMLYAWENPEEVDAIKSPELYIKPRARMTALVPARHEEMVIVDTIRAIDRIDYPEELKETLIICQDDDVKTIAAVNTAIAQLGKDSIRLITFNGAPVNKPHSLNIGLRHATGNVIVVFDAEDEPHKDIYQIANTVMVTRKADVLQSGVQLMNYDSRWFSTLNVLEYFFWFKSVLQYFAQRNTIPLGGNTVFFRRKWLERVGGWDEDCLTEDGDIGIRMSKAGANIQVVYDEEHVTREETPLDIKSFIKQRTRWNQGFVQILLKGEWAKLPTFSRKLLALYILLWPEMQAILFLLIPVSFFLLLTVKLPVIFAIIMNIPFYILLIQIIIQNIGLYEFTKEYKVKYHWYSPLLVTIAFFPYQLLLGYSALRAIIRVISGADSWEKTSHMNTHRQEIILRPAF